MIEQRQKKDISLKINKKVISGVLPISFLNSVIINTNNEKSTSIAYNNRYEQYSVYRRRLTTVISKIYEIP